MPKPNPVPQSLVCSECGLPWQRHVSGSKTAPTLDVCVKLLKAELAKRSAYSYANSAATNLTGWVQTF